MTPLNSGNSFLLSVLQKLSKFAKVFAKNVLPGFYGPQCRLIYASTLTEYIKLQLCKSVSSVDYFIFKLVISFP